MIASDSDNRNKALDAALHILGEQFEHVQIMATSTIEGKTVSNSRGCGNWYARLGMAHEFINEEVARENALKIADKLKPE